MTQLTHLADRSHQASPVTAEVVNLRRGADGGVKQRQRAEANWHGHSLTDVVPRRTLGNTGRVRVTSGLELDAVTTCISRSLRDYGLEGGAESGAIGGGSPRSHSDLQHLINAGPASEHLQG